MHNVLATLRPLPLLAPALLALASACEDDPWCVAQEGASATICVLDQHGEPLGADQAWWYWPPDGGSYDGEHEATCADSPTCALWTVPDTTVGDFYVSAWWRGPAHHDPACRYESFDAAAVSVAPDTLGTGVIGVAVELTLDTTAEQCE